jgi:hypothetical protein
MNRLPFDETRTVADLHPKAGNHARKTMLSSISVKGLPVKSLTATGHIGDPHRAVVFSD